MSYVDKVVNAKRQVSYRARWRDPSGKQKAKTFEREKEARDFLVTVDHSKRGGSYVDPHAGKLLVGEYAATWLAGRDTRDSTQARDASLFRTSIVPRFGAVPIGRIRRAEVATWRQELLTDKSAATVSKVLTLFKAMLSGAVHDGLLPANPLDGLKLPSQAREEMRFLTAGELLRLADAIDGRYRALVLLGGYGGLRIGELAGLQVGDLDMLRGVVSVERQVVEVAGKLTVGPLKTRAARRKVKLPKFVVEELAAHLSRGPGLSRSGPDPRNPDNRVFQSLKNRIATFERGAGRTGLGDNPDKAAARKWADARTHAASLVFPAPGGGLLSRTAFRQRFWLPAVLRSGVGANLRVHDLRHTAVALWIAAGYSPKAIATRAGHTSVRTVLDVYGHLLPDADDALADRLDELARGTEVGTGRVLKLSKLGE